LIILKILNKFWDKNPDIRKKWARFMERELNSKKRNPMNYEK